MVFAQRLVIILLVISVLAGIMTAQPLYYRLAYLWAFLIAGSWLMARLSLRGVRLIRTTRTLRSQVGQVFEERYEIQNPGRLPRLWIEVHDESPLPFSRGSHVLSLVGGRESRTYLARTRLSERGIFPLGPTQLHSGDIFGLFPASRSYPSENSLLVYPMLFGVRYFPGPAGLLPGGEALRRRTPQITSNASGVREYAPGDPLNRIHWLSTARRNRLIVKEFELDPLAEVWFVVDAFRTAHIAQPVSEDEAKVQDIWRPKTPYKLPPSTIEYAASTAGSLARYYLERARTVGMVTSGNPVRVLPADRDARQLNKVLEALAIIRPDGSTPLQGVIEAQMRYLPRGSTVVLITPSASQGVVTSADFLLRRGMRPVVVAIDSASFGGHFDNAEVIANLQMLGIPVVKLVKDDDLGEVLSTASQAHLLG